MSGSSSGSRATKRQDLSALKLQGVGQELVLGSQRGRGLGSSSQRGFTVLDSSSPPFQAFLLPLEHTRHIPISGACVGIPSALNSSPQPTSALHFSPPPLEVIFTLWSCFLLNEAFPDHPVIIVIPAHIPDPSLRFLPITLTTSNIPCHLLLLSPSLHWN